MPRIVHVVGARPNFVKIAPILAALRARPSIEQRLVHTGQHYDPRLVDVFFAELGLPAPDHDLGVGSGSHAAQTAAVLERIDGVLADERPDLVVVVGDVNSTLAAALAAVKRGIAVAHVEAGLRSFDRSMPEEINRTLTDHCSTLLFAPTEEAVANLRREGIPEARISLVGNVMLDTLSQHRHRLVWPPPGLEIGWARGGYGVLTLHRAANVDDPDRLRRLLATLEEAARGLPFAFPVHPRTRARLGATGAVPRGLRLVDPLGYVSFLSLVSQAACVVTDSGGLQEEATALGVPCFTVRDSTEWTRTVIDGTNTLVGSDGAGLRSGLADVLASGGRRRRGATGDSGTGARIAAVLAAHLGVPAPAAPLPTAV